MRPVWALAHPPGPRTRSVAIPVVPMIDDGCGNPLVVSHSMPLVVTVVAVAVTTVLFTPANNPSGWYARV